MRHWFIVKWNLVCNGTVRYPRESDDLEASEGKEVSTGAVDPHSVVCCKENCGGESRGWSEM